MASNKIHSDGFLNVLELFYSDTMPLFLAFLLNMTSVFFSFPPFKLRFHDVLAPDFCVPLFNLVFHYETSLQAIEMSKRCDNFI